MQTLIDTQPSLDLKVTIDQSSGFCFGVVFAIEMAEEILREEGKLFCLGDIVHLPIGASWVSFRGKETPW